MDIEGLDEYFYGDNDAEYQESSSESEAEEEEADDVVDLATILDLRAAVRREEGDGNDDENDENEGEAPVRPDIDSDEMAIPQEQAIDDLKQLSGCKCGTLCLRFLTPAQLNHIRVMQQSMDKNSLDLVILGKLSVLIMTTATVTDRQDNHVKERTKSRVRYSHEGENLL